MPAAPTRTTLLAAAGLLILAAAFWALFLPRAEESVFGRVPYLDEVLYLDRAVAERDGTAADTPHFMAPLYPRLIAAVGSGAEAPGRDLFTAGELRGIRALQIACWLGTLVLLVLGGQRLAAAVRWRGRAALVTAWLPPLLFLLYRPAAVFAVSVLVETVLTFLVLLSLFVTWRAADGGRRLVLLAILAGVALGTGALLRGSCLAVLPVAGWFLWRSAEDRRGSLVAVAALVGACVLVLLPAVVQGSRAAGRLAGPSFNAGVNLHIGNGPAANGFYVQTIPGDLRDDPAGLRVLAARHGRQDLTLPEADQLWRDEALASMKERPLRAAGLWFKKVWLHLQAWEIDQIAPLGPWQAEVPLLRGLAVPYALIMALAVAGVVAGWRLAPVRYLALAVLLLIAGQSVFFVVARYRQVLVPLCALLAGVGAGALFARPRHALLPLAAGALLVVPWGLGGVSDQVAALGWANAAQRWGVVAAHDGDPQAYARAEELYRRALDGHAAAWEPWLGLATVLDAQRRTPEAVQVLENGIAAAERPGDLERRLVALLIRLGRVDEALTRTRAGLARDSHDPDMLHNAAYLLARTGELAAAERYALQLVAQHAADPRGYADLGIIKMRQGDAEAARRAFAAGLQAVPGDPELMRHLQRLQGE